MSSMSSILIRFARSYASLKAAGVFCLIALVAPIAVEPAVGAVVIDGNMKGAAEYSVGFYLNLEVEGLEKGDPNIPVADPGQLWLYQDQVTHNVSVGLTLPRTLVDNSYGTNSIGWGSSAPSGKNHNFKDLVGSDDAQLLFKDGSTTLLDMAMDYLHEFKVNPLFASGGVTDGEGKVSTTTADILEAESSMGFNYATFGVSNPELFGDGADSPETDSDTSYNVTDALLAAWNFDVSYEFKIDGSVFGKALDLSNPAAFMEVNLFHVSPNKIGKNKVYDDIGPPVEAVPEPGSLVIWSLLGGIGIVVGWRRRRSNASQ